MTVRERLEQLEYQILAPYATKSAESRGRPTPEPPDPVRTAFQRDRDRIIHSKAFRRLKHKTQVFLDPNEDHYRTRLTHTLEVAQIARTISRALRLNEDLTEAVALAHDLGHPPFGTRAKRRWTKSCGSISPPRASATTSRACAWWTASRKTGAG
jgi:dGTPase